MPRFPGIHTRIEEQSHIFWGLVSAVQGFLEVKARLLKSLGVWALQNQTKSGVYLNLMCLHFPCAGYTHTDTMDVLRGLKDRDTLRGLEEGLSGLGAWSGCGRVDAVAAQTLFPAWEEPPRIRSSARK